MNCVYCYRPCLESDGRFAHLSGAFDCQTCYARFMYTVDLKKLCITYLRTYFGNIEYCIKIFHLRSRTVLAYWSDELDMPSSKILDFPYILNINPQNILNKIQTLLVFS